MLTAEEKEARRKSYYEKNKEKRQARDREYYEKNKEAIKEKQRLWLLANPEYQKDKQKEWKEKNPTYQKEYYEANKEAVLEYGKDWRKNNPDKVAMTVRKAALKRNYGLTIEQYEGMLAEQNNKCSICDSDLIPGIDTCVDHCHNTGAVRGILCSKCNKGLGLFLDSPERLYRAMEYLINCFSELAQPSQ